MKTEKTQENQSVSPADVWEKLSLNQQAQITHLLAGMIYKLATMGISASTEGAPNGKRHDSLIELNERAKNL